MVVTECSALQMVVTKCSALQVVVTECNALQMVVTECNALQIGIFHLSMYGCNMNIRVITKLPNSEQSYKGKVKTHKYINRQNQSITGKLKTVMTLTWYRHF